MSYMRKQSGLTLLNTINQDRQTTNPFSLEYETTTKICQFFAGFIECQAVKILDSDNFSH